MSVFLGVGFYQPPHTLTANVVRILSYLCLQKKPEIEKGKKAPFKGKKTKISPKKNQLDIDWFDNDAFFGFDG